MRYWPGSRRARLIAAGVVVLPVVTLAAATLLALRPLPASLSVGGTVARSQFLARDGEPLNITWANDWNVHAQVPLYGVPLLLREALLESEDRDFLGHGGPDWRARGAAVVQNLRAGATVRGASTITEQVVRMWQPRPRTLWSRWVEGFEAMRFEARFSKGELLEFYLNQVPYAAQRRGVLPAARYWFGRDLETLSRREMLALVVLVRAPARNDLHRAPAAVDGSLRDLATRLEERGVLAPGEAARLRAEPLELGAAAPPVEASHFVAHASRARGAGPAPARVSTTLDADLQREVQALLDARLAALADQQVRNGAVLVVDHRSAEVLAWVVGGAGSRVAEGSAYDAVRSPRQPGSTLKPLLYAQALDRGWTAATLVEDAPLEEAVGSGLHAFRNFSRTHYGALTVREALGNSLNVPAIHAIRFVGPGEFLARLRRLGMASLDGDVARYGEGLALGNGEVSLFELTQAYAALARGGSVAALRWSTEEPRRTERVFSAEAASLIGNILSDPAARRREFGAAALMRMPTQTAVKTGTSNDHRDAWAMGFDRHHTVGVWMGNLDATPTRDLTGATGPLVVLRGVFAGLRRDADAGPLWLSPRLVARSICARDGGPPRPDCPQRDEWFGPGTGPSELTAATEAVAEPRIVRPHPGLLLAADPRIPDALEGFEFAVEGPVDVEQVEWSVDGEVVALSPGTRWTWPVRRGAHQVTARVWLSGAPEPVALGAVHFAVR